MTISLLNAISSQNVPQKSLKESLKDLNKQSYRHRQYIIGYIPKIKQVEGNNEFDVYLDGNETVKEGWLHQAQKIYVQLTR